MKREYHCDLCNRKLPHERWIFSTFTKARYCWPGECGHDKRGKKRRKDKATDYGHPKDIVAALGPGAQLTLGG